jgi:hypothetical protein
MAEDRVPQGNGEVVVQDVSKHFGSICALDGIQLTVNGGEFFTLLGRVEVENRHCYAPSAGSVGLTAGAF